MSETWKDIKGYEGLYQVSDKGRVRNADGLIMSQTKRGKYLKVGLSKNGIKKGVSVHRLVALAFIDNPNDLPYVNHKDEDKHNNVATNLEWCTAQYNSTYGTAKERNVVSRRKPVIATDVKTGEEHYFPSLSEAQKQGFAKTSAISRAIAGWCGMKQTGGYYWKYV